MHDIDYCRSLITAQNDWKTDRTFLPERVARWMLDPASMTEKLRCRCRRLTIKVVSENWLGEIWNREVVLRGDNSNWLFAQTEIPRALAEADNGLLQLGSRPIGPWLFAQDSLRSEIQWRQDEESGLYMRRSAFKLCNQKLCISELFLDDFPFSDG